MEWMRTKLVCACALVAVGAGLLVAGFVVPPRGEIHNSVLVAFGEALTFVGAVFGVELGRAKARSGAQGELKS